MSVLLSKMEGEELRKYAIPKDAQRSVLEDTIFKVRHQQAVPRVLDAKSTFIKEPA